MKAKIDSNSNYGFRTGLSVHMMVFCSQKKMLIMFNKSKCAVCIIYAEFLIVKVLVKYLW